MANQFKYKHLLIKSGDRVVVHQLVQEKDKKRVQRFEGTVISIRKGVNSSFTVRKLANLGIGVERIFPIDSPWIDKIEIKEPAKARRAKLYFLRSKKSKKDLKLPKDEKRVEELKQKRRQEAKLKKK